MVGIPEVVIGEMSSRQYVVIHQWMYFMLKTWIKNVQTGIQEKHSSAVIYVKNSN
jgi:hypothetical protein